MNILGINSVYHESSAALLVDGKIVVACEEERFNRVKHAKEARFYNPHELPEHAIRFCLDYAGVRASEIDRVAYSFDPHIRRAEFHAEWWPDPQMEPQFLGYLGKIGEGHGVDRAEVIAHTPAVAQRHAAESGLELLDPRADRCRIRRHPAEQNTE